MSEAIIFESEARLEFEDAVAWHNNEKPGLGDSFGNEVYALLDRLAINPGRFRLVGKTVRVARLKVFWKYSIYFHVEPDFVGVVAVFHSSRDPAELIRRLK